MPNPDIPLTPEEQALFDKISFDGHGLDYDATVRNGEHVAALMKSLMARKVIPPIRMQWFTDPEYRIGQRKGSRRDLLLRNAKTHDEMVRHASFLKHLRYFVCGPDLPADAIRRFSDEVKAVGHVSGDDVLDIAKLARGETRRLGLSPQDACEEYFKLALDCGLWVAWAFMIREQVKTIK